ncbi:hypothetical protein [Streptosporangium sp. NPDC049644]|uniref:hypothetical protein n=1 Tax=Streptosporangium sp. NPDC049644 TaxID=3155507 RepID=UPI0034148966
MLVRSEIDSNLSSGPFGSYELLHEDHDTFLEGRAWAYHLESPPKTALTSPQVLARISQRMNHDLTGYDLPWDRLSPMLGETAERWTSPAPWLDGHPVWTITDWADADARQLLSLMREIFRFSAFDGEFQAGSVSSDDMAKVRRACSILQEAIPHISANTLPLVRLLLMPDTMVPSWHLMQIPESIGIGQTFLRQASDLVIAESILHECLHEKYVQLRLVRGLLASCYTDDSSPGVLLPWTLTQPRKRIFKVNRTLSTLHVYAHLTAFHAAVLETPELVEHHPEASARIRLNYERGAYLSEALSWREISNHLGSDGDHLHKWLESNALAPARKLARDREIGLRPYPTERWSRRELVSA